MSGPAPALGHIEDQVIRERTKEREIIVLTRWHAILRSAKQWTNEP